MKTRLVLVSVDALIKYFEYLDGVKKNRPHPVFQSVGPLQTHFLLARGEAKAVFAAWISSYHPTRSMKERAERAKGLRSDIPTDIRKYRTKVQK